MRPLFLAENVSLSKSEVLLMVTELFGHFFVPKWALIFAQTTLVILVLLLAWFSNALLRNWIIKWLKRFIEKTETRFDNYLIEHHVLEKFSHLAPMLCIYFFAPVIFPASESLNQGIQRFALVYMLIIAALFIGALVEAVLALLDSLESTGDKPLRSYAQVLKILIWLITTVLVLSVVLGRSPWALLGGLGAFTALLMLVFRDSILGFVASIQMTTLDLVREGDWIEMPRYGANGSVIGFSLTTIKVQNWDQTISTIPTYAVISDSFKNWRGMTESGGRRIVRAVYLDMTSIKFLSEDLLSKLKKIKYIQGYLKDKQNDISEWNQKNNIDDSSLANGRNLTNIGTFRAYIDAYLREHPMLDQENTFLVRQLPPGPQGLGIELYVFSKEQRWVYYEGLIADIFDHILAVTHIFELRVFQQPTGYDIQSL